MPRLLFTLSIVMLTVSVCAPEPDWNVRDHIPLEQFTIQSHRGAGILMPENSIQAFTIAWDLGTVPEADLRTTKDGVIVAFHDKNFRRVLPDAPSSEQERGVEDVAYRELAKLDIGFWRGEEFAGQRVPRMSDVFDVLQQHPERRLYIDVKDVDLQQLADESRAVHPQLILASSKYAEICRWKELAPRAKTLHWMGGTEQALEKRLQSLRTKNFECIDQLQIHVRVDDFGEMQPTGEYLQRIGTELRDYGVLFQVLPWEIRDPEVFKRLLDLGVASFATDYPDVVAEVVRKYYTETW